MPKQIYRSLLVTTSIALAVLTSGVRADPISATGTILVLDNRSSNDAGTGVGIIDEIGALNVIPNGAAGTTGIATLGPNTVTLRALAFSTLPNFFASGIPDDGTVNTRGSWALTFTNGLDTKTVYTPTIPLSAVPLPFVNNVYASATGLTPTLNWTDTVSGAQQSVQVRDNGENADLSGGYAADLIMTTYLPPGTNTYTLPTGLLTGGHEYSIEIDQELLRDPTGPVNVTNIYDRSRAFFDYSASSGPGPSDVYLPIVGKQPNGLPSYSFNITAVVGSTYYLDPEVAKGYKFTTQDGGPNYASVTLPDIVGTSEYTIVLPDGRTFSVAPDVAFDFTGIAGESLGVPSFTVLGISPSSAVNPYNPLAFDAGVAFVSDGTFLGSMDPLVVPERSTWSMMLLGFVGLGFVGYRTSRRAVSLPA